MVRAVRGTKSPAFTEKTVKNFRGLLFWCTLILYMHVTLWLLYLWTADIF